MRVPKKTTPAPKGKMRLRLAAVVCLALAGCLWFRIPGVLARYQANKLVYCEQLLSADVWYQRATDWGDDSPELWFYNARLSRKLARDAKFVEYLGIAVAKGLPAERANIEVRLAQAQRGELAPLESVLSELFIKGDDADEICYAYAQGCLLKYRLDEAINILDLWQADYPNDARPHFLRGRILEHRSNAVGAGEEFRKALQKNRYYASAAYNLGRILEGEQKPAEAISYYLIASRNLRNPVPGLVGKARCERLLQKYDQAQITLQQAEQASNESDQEAFRLVGDQVAGADATLLTEQGYLAANLDQHEQAVEYLSEAVERNPHDWRARYQLGTSQKQIGKSEQANENLRQVSETKAALATCDRLFDVLKKEPENIEARLQIGKTFLEHISENQGLIWLNSVLDTDPKNIEAHTALATFFRNQQNLHPEYVALAKKHEAYIPLTDEQTDP